MTDPRIIECAKAFHEEGIRLSQFEAMALGATPRTWDELTEKVRERLCGQVLVCILTWLKQEPSVRMEKAADDLNPGSGLPYEPGTPREVYTAMCAGAAKEISR